VWGIQFLFEAYSGESLIYNVEEVFQVVVNMLIAVTVLFLVAKYMKNVYTRFFGMA
jgi:hypothetical protein